MNEPTSFPFVHLPLAATESLHPCRGLVNQSATAAETQARLTNNLRRNAAAILPFLAEPDTLDVCVNADARLWVNRLGRGFTCEGTLAPSTTRLLLSGIATVRQIAFDHAHPILETIFPLTGDRIEGLIPPVVTNALFAIRTRPKKMYSLDDLTTSGVLTDQTDPLNAKRYRDDFLERVSGCKHAEVLRLAIEYRRNILLVGPPGSGKTTVGSAIIAAYSTASNERVVMIEDTPELQCVVPNHLQLLATGQITQADLLVASLRLMPNRLIIGEVRDEAPARVLLSAWNTGHSGGLATIHANDCRDGLRRLESLVGGDAAAVRERIAGAIHLVVFIDREDSLAAGRKVREVAVVRSFDRATQDYVLQFV